MKDKVAELKKIMEQKKELEQKTLAVGEESCEDQHGIEEAPEETLTPTQKQPQASPLLPTELELLQTKNAELLQANTLQKDMYLRQMADFENARKRLMKEQDDTIRFANEKLLRDIFPLLDSLDMMLSHVTEKDQADPVIQGIELIHKQFLQTLEKHGLKEIPAEGVNFDPHLHEAVSTEKVADVPSGQVVKVHRKGYKLNERLIRAALVTVSQ